MPSQSLSPHKAVIKKSLLPESCFIQPKTRPAWKAAGPIYPKTGSKIAQELLKDVEFQSAKERKRIHREKWRGRHERRAAAMHWKEELDQVYLLRNSKEQYLGANVCLDGEGSLFGSASSLSFANADSQRLQMSQSQASFFGPTQGEAKLSLIHI